jgi:hypothetical protein
MTARQITEPKAIALIVGFGFTVTKIAGPNETHIYRVVDTHGAEKIFTPSELRRAAFVWS